MKNRVAAVFLWTMLWCVAPAAEAIPIPFGLHGDHSALLHKPASSPALLQNRTVFDGSSDPNEFATIIENLGTDQLLNLILAKETPAGENPARDLGKPPLARFDIGMYLNLAALGDAIQVEGAPIDRGAALPQSRPVEAVAEEPACPSEVPCPASTTATGTQANRTRASSFKIPEPATLALVGIGLIGMGIRRRRSPPDSADRPQLQRAWRKDP